MTYWYRQAYIALSSDHTMQTRTSMQLLWFKSRCDRTYGAYVIFSVTYMYVRYA